jgi:phage shock protein A
VNLLARVRRALARPGGAAREPVADPVAELERAYAQQIDALERVRTAIAGVLSSEKRLELASRRAGAIEGERLDREIAAVRALRATLEATAADLKARIGALRTRKMALAANLAVAAATRLVPEPSAAADAQADAVLARFADPLAALRAAATHVAPDPAGNRGQSGEQGSRA